MKFGKRLGAEAARGWQGTYLDYKACKRAIRQDVESKGASSHMSFSDATLPSAAIEIALSLNVSKYHAWFFSEVPIAQDVCRRHSS